VGIAGPTGSGKSTVCRLLSRRPGYVHVDCDLLAKRAYDPEGPAYEEVVKAFGPEVLSPDGEVDRRKLAEIVFSDPEKKRCLEEIVHPRVAQDIERIAAEEKAKGTEVLLVEGALLFSSPHTPRELFDLAIWLEAPEEVRRERLLASGLPSEAVELRISAQRDLVPPEWVQVVDAARPVEEVVRDILSLIQDFKGKGARDRRAP